MHLVIDAVGAKFGGAVTVLLNFLKEAEEDDRIDRLTVFMSPRELRRFDLPPSQKRIDEEIPSVDNSVFNRIRWSIRGMGRRAAELGADAVLCLSNIGSAPLPCIVFVQQSLPFSTEAMAALRMQERARLVFIREMMRYSCVRAEHILVQTPIMVSNIQRAFKIDSEKISYVMPSLDPYRSAVIPDHPIVRELKKVPHNRRILYVGSDSRYKMLTTLIQGMQFLRTLLPDTVLFLTLPSDHEYATVEGVVCCGYLDENVLNHTYKESTLLVMPSLTETVGLPMLEALNAGTPVAAADRPYAHFICEDAAVYFDPFSPYDFARVVARVLDDSELHKDLSQKASILVSSRARQSAIRRAIDHISSFTAPDILTSVELG